MASRLFANPMKLDVQIALTIYDRWQQTTKRHFFLRNLLGESESEQAAHARKILEGLAAELHYLTRFGVDKGVIRIDGKKVDEVVFPHYLPDEKASYFVYGVRLDFVEHYAYSWQKQGQRGQRKTWVLSEADWEDGWQRQVVRDVQKKALRIPCMIGDRHEPGYFFHYLGPQKRGRKVVGWSVKYDLKDAVYQQFISRFYKAGNLSLGNDRSWIENSQAISVHGVKWEPLKIKTSPLPRKSRLASQPKDDTDYVYLIRMGQKLIFKIGKTNDPQGRLASLQTGSPYTLKLAHLFQADNASAAEETLHTYFHGKRMAGEWFQLNKNEYEALCRVKAFCDGCFMVGEERLEVVDVFAAGNG